MINKLRIANDLKQNLGIKQGETLLIKVNLGAIGMIDSKKRSDYLEAILAAIGDEGTLVTFAFTETSFIKVNPEIIFDGHNKSYLGTFANLMLNHPKMYRSEHPTNSFVAIGKYAKEMTQDHDANSHAYEPIRRVIERGGRILTIGADKLTPGFVTHLVEIDLGIHKRIIFPWLTRALYKKHGQTLLFKRRDIGGCTDACYKFYGEYIKAEALMQGYVGAAYTLLIEGKTAYEIDKAILKNDPKFTLCTSKDCLKCRARRWDNLGDAPGFIFRKLLKKFATKLKL